MNRYYGNSGRRESYPEPGNAPPPGPASPPPLQKPIMEPPRPRQDRGGKNPLDVSRLLSRFSRNNFEQEDLLLMLVLYLLYRESGDRELLITLGALLFL